MGIAIKIDEDLPNEMTALLVAAGHDAVSVVMQRLTGAKDEAIWPIVQQEGRCLFTADKGFADARVHRLELTAALFYFAWSRNRVQGIYGWRNSSLTNST